MANWDYLFDELQATILGFMSYKELLAARPVSRRFAELSRTLAEAKTKAATGVSYDKITPKQAILAGDYYYVVINKIKLKLQRACRSGSIDLVNLVIRSPFIDKEQRGTDYWDWGLREACRGGHMAIIELMIAKGANNWNWGLCGACRGGHMAIVELMIAKGANYWNSGLCGACRGGHTAIVELMIAKGATQCNCNKPISEH